MYLDLTDLIEIEQGARIHQEIATERGDWGLVELYRRAIAWAQIKIQQRERHERWLARKS